jgi:hypothetical protein
MRREYEPTLPEMLETLAFAAQRLAVNALGSTREQKGFQAFIFDLKEASNNTVGSNWNFTNGLLTVLPGADPDEINEFLKSKLSDKPWFQSTPPADLSIQSPIPYAYAFKVLGKYGANLAVDPTLFLVNGKEPVKLLAIIRPDGTRALPGGMMESNVKKTCVDELLEECYSGNFFKTYAITSDIIDAPGYWETFAPNQQLPQLVAAVISQTKQLSSGQRALIQEAVYAAASTVSEKPSDLIRRVCQTIEELPDAPPQFGACQRAQALAHVRVALYEKACPAQYAALQVMLDSHMHIGTQVPNLSDPRNTDIAWMETRAVSMAVDSKVMDELKTWGLESQGGAGDDARDSYFPTLEAFCCSESSRAYSDHAALVLNALASEIRQGLDVTPALLKQFQAIATDFRAKLPDDSMLPAIIERLDLMLARANREAFVAASHGRDEENDDQDLRHKGPRNPEG